MKLIEHFLRFLAPDDCLECGFEGALLCAICVKSRLQSVPARCYRCYRLTPGSKTCPACIRHSALATVWVRTLYVPTARKVVHALKFNYSRDVANIIASELCLILPALPADTVIVHVPAASSHTRQRGFDQSALIAREVSHIVKRAHVHALVRYGQ